MISKIKEAIQSVEGGPGILEMSHRSSSFDRVINKAIDQITQLYRLPESHEVIFLQGGASLQFAMVPLNLGVLGGFITTGEWSKRALAEARLVAGEGGQQPRELWSSQAEGFRSVPREVELAEALEYVHITSNNTIYGTQYRDLPSLCIIKQDDAQSSTRTLPFVIDASSDLFSRSIDWSRVDLVYAGAQKNAGPSGVTIVIGRRELLRGEPCISSCPTLLRYRTHAEKGSLYHTPNTLGIFAVGEVAQWVNDAGGLEFFEARAEERATRVYEVIDAYPEIYQGHAERASRSHMNLTFRMHNAEQEQALLRRARELGMVGLKGHRSVGGLRASLYNAVSDESVNRLINLLEAVATQRA